jgi:hypothetical protein
MLKVMDANTNESCKHTPPAVIVDATSPGYRIRCLGCGAAGPLREYSERAWTDLEDWRYEEANPSRRRISLY